jgi:hypothetical protein
MRLVELFGAGWFADVCAVESVEKMIGGGFRGEEAKSRSVPGWF